MVYIPYFSYKCMATVMFVTQMSIKWMDKHIQKLLNRFCKAYYDDFKYSDFDNGDDNNENDIWQ